jgi:IS5 family transposase
MLVKAAKARGVVLRQNYNRLSKRGLHQYHGYAHAKQMKRAKKCAKRMRNYLGRVIRDIERQVSSPDVELQKLLQIGRHIFGQQKKDKNKVYSVHEPEVSCISKGKAHKRYEFGCKVSVAVTSKGGWVVGTQAFSGNPYDGHTLKSTLKQIERLSPKPVQQVFVDLGYRGHGHEGDTEIYVVPKRRGRIALSLWRWMKRRSAVEPTIGHLKKDHGMERNPLKGVEGDKVNAILSACGMNFSKLLTQLFTFFTIGIDTIISNKFCIKRNKALCTT